MGWRPRDYNTSADHAAKFVLASGNDVDTLDETNLLDMPQTAVALQIFSDGTGEIGAAAVVFMCIIDTGTRFENKLI